MAECMGGIKRVDVLSKRVGNGWPLIEMFGEMGRIQVLHHTATAWVTQSGGNFVVWVFDR